MQAVILNGFGGIENFQLVELPAPAIKHHEVLLSVKAISINPVDAKTRQGKAQAKVFEDRTPIILGWDVSGVVIQAGDAVQHLKEGDEVFGMINFPGAGCAYATEVAAPAEQLAIKPKNISHAEAAASTLAALTAWQALTDHLQIKKGERLLVHAAAGGVGHFAIQIATYLGAYVIGTASAANKDFVLGLGADECIDYKAQPLHLSVKNIDKLMDNVGGEAILDESLLLLNRGGSILSLPSGGNTLVKDRAAAKGMVGLTMMVHSSGSDQQRIADLLEAKMIRPQLSRIFALKDIPAAHTQIESARTVGKLVVELP